MRDQKDRLVMNLSHKVKGPVNLYAKLLNVSPEGMRFFERKGILNPERSRETGYRLYGANDGTLVIYYKMYRQYGFGLHESADMVKDIRREDMLKTLCDREAALQKEIEEQQRIHTALQERIVRYEKAEANLNVYSLCDRPAFYFVACRRDNALLDDAKSVEMTSRCNRSQPYTDVGVVHTQDGCVEMGHLIEEKHAHRLGLEHTAYKPCVRCIYSVMQCSGDISVLQYALFDEIKREMRKKGYRAVGEPIARDLMPTLCEDGYHHIFEIWVPIAE